MMNKLFVFFISAILLFGCAKKASSPNPDKNKAEPTVSANAPTARPSKNLKNESFKMVIHTLKGASLDAATLREVDAPSKGVTSTKNAFDVVDEQLKKMSFGNIAFNTPKTINIDSTKTIHLKLDLKKSIDELKNTMNSQEEKAGAQIKVSDQMEARLKGKNFDIEPLTPETQAISSNETTDWMWRVKPTAEGNQDLNLTLSAILDVNGKAIPRKVEVFVKVIEVKVTVSQKIQLFVEKNWQWLWATLVIPIAGWLWKKKKLAA